MRSNGKLGLWFPRHPSWDRRRAVGYVQPEVRGEAQALGTKLNLLVCPWWSQKHTVIIFVGKESGKKREDLRQSF